MKRLLVSGLLAGLMVLGCGGSSSSPTAPPPPPPPPPPPSEGIFFTADASAAGSTIFLNGIDTSNIEDEFIVEVRAEGVEDLYGVSFDLQYPSDLLTWRRGRFEEGTFLSADGSVETEILVDRRPAGNLVVGITRVGDVAGVSGSGVLLTFEFINEAVAGDGDLIFSDNDAVDSAGQFQDAQWLAGSIESKI